MNIPPSLKAGIVVIASLIGAVIASDLALRAVGYAPQVDHEWLLGPGGNFRAPNDKLILIHPQFLTDRFYNVDTTRETIVTLGDSFTEGYPVAEVDKYPSVLRRLLGERGRDVNVINLGIGDSGPDQHLRLLKHYLLSRLTPDIVVWSFYPNDIRDNLRQAVYGIENDTLVPLDATEHWVYIRQTLYDHIPLPRTIKEGSPVLRLLFRALEIWGKSHIQGNGPSEQAWGVAKIRLAIEEMERLGQAHGFQIAYVLIAPQALYLKEQDPAVWEQNSHITAYKQLRPIVGRQTRFVDAWFDDAKTQACGSEFIVPEALVPAWSTIFTDDERDENRLGDQHFNELGYLLLADVVATCLLSERTSRRPQVGSGASSHRRPSRQR